ncbi:PREDICTED: TAF6-like RNA polymerase II p300/CBP-associated factor-associated factor 65 kDa subunit 6L [Priapulus caudatus]|uniref:TAF6-like RNA polymerase II p300/CBP-associated factor-associated factor 65 kDa subunit 6L n=1 Tax=Priapulus caudatus TaxID=37621 RepID=A0ABM1ED40_PRICU|nr:PREDICTED: TAF6-like RNA polymerase II p300/CBP-associated factor-associated factor 65 kDa subunit 6L [Priapulus caudatus]
MNEERKAVDEKSYSQVSAQTVKLFAEMVGISDLPDGIADLLAEDSSYRLREITQSSCQYMRHSKRKKLMGTDFNKALKNSDLEPIYGYSHMESAKFVHVPEVDLYCAEDPPVCLVTEALESIEVKHLTPTHVKAHWLSVEGGQKGNSSSRVPSGNINGHVQKALSPHLLLYYENVTNAILSDDSEITQVALKDLRSNGNISSLLPYLINFVSCGVKAAGHDLVRLSKLLNVMRALIRNAALYFAPKPYLQVLTQSVKLCVVVEPPATSTNLTGDHWILRDQAALLLAEVVRRWHTPVNRLRQHTVKGLLDTLRDFSRPLPVHYGAIMALIAFGHETLDESLLPFMPTYWQYLQGIVDDTSSAKHEITSNARTVYGALLLAAEIILRHKIKTLSSSKLKATAPTPLPPPAITKNLPVQETAHKVPERSVTMDTTPDTSAIVSVKIEPDSNPAFVASPVVGVGFAPLTIDTSLAAAAATTTMAGADRGAGLLATRDESADAKSMADVYRELSEMFGDALALRLPVLPPPRSRPAGTPVDALAADRRSGSELLREIEKQVAPPHEPSPSLESYADDAMDLAIKETVHDPDLGIKVTIARRRRRTADDRAAAAAAAAQQRRRPPPRSYRLYGFDDDDDDDGGGGDDDAVFFYAPRPRREFLFNYTGAAQRPPQALCRGLAAAALPQPSYSLYQQMSLQVAPLARGRIRVGAGSQRHLLASSNLALPL